MSNVNKWKWSQPRVNMRWIILQINATIIIQTLHKVKNIQELDNYSTSCFASYNSRYPKSRGTIIVKCITFHYPSRFFQCHLYTFYSAYTLYRKKTKLECYRNRCPSVRKLDLIQKKHQSRSPRLKLTIPFPSLLDNKNYTDLWTFNTEKDGSLRLSKSHMRIKYTTIRDKYRK